MNKFFAKVEYKWILRLITLVMLVITGTVLIIAPRESDAVYDIGTPNMSIELSDIVFDGDFERVLADGSREAVVVPGDNVASPGEVFVIESVIPDDFNEDYIITKATHQELKIYIDGELRVDYGTGQSKFFGKDTANRYLLCKTSKEDAGKILRIETIASVNKYSGTTNTVYCSSKSGFWSAMFREYGSSLVFGFVIILLGIFSIGTSVAIEICYGRNFELEYIGWCVTYVGTWLVCDSKLRQLITPNVSPIATITFIVIILAPIPLSVYVDVMQKRRYRKLFGAVKVAAWLNFAVSTILSFFKITTYVDLLPITHAILIITFIVIVVTMMIDFKKGSMADYKIICIGLLCLMISATFEIVAAYFVDIISGLALTMGTIAFIFTAIVKTITDVRREAFIQQEQKLEEQRKQSEALSMQMIRTLSDTLEAKDEYTRGHSRRVADYSIIIAEELGMSKEERDRLHYAASLHDIGKIGVPDTILNKPKGLTDAEYSIIKNHTVIGADILKKIEIIAYAEQVARHHHERYDGKGYPAGLSGENIPYEARIVALADSYDAMNSKRIYRKPVAKEVIREEIIKNRGTQFDPEMADVFIKLFDRGAFELQDTSSVDIIPVDDANKMLTLLVDTISAKASESDIDFLTGLPMRKHGEKLISEKLSSEAGALMFFDMDNLKKINDLYGHQAGDKALQLLGMTINEHVGDGVVCRIGGDEFVLYLPNPDEGEAFAIADDIAKTFIEKKNADCQIAVASVSVGLTITSAGEMYSTVFARADKALYHVKHIGKSGIHMFNKEMNELSHRNVHIDMDKLIDAIRNAGEYKGAMDLETRAFSKMYGYLANLCARYDYNCQIVLITNEVVSGEVVPIEDIEKSMEYMEIAIKDAIRTVDVCTRHGSLQFLVILLEAKSENVDAILNRIFSQFHRMFKESWLSTEYEVRSMLIQDENDKN